MVACTGVDTVEVVVLKLTTSVPASKITDDGTVTLTEFEENRNVRLVPVELPATVRVAVVPLPPTTVGELNTRVLATANWLKTHSTKTKNKTEDFERIFSSGGLKVLNQLEQAELKHGLI